MVIDWEWDAPLKHRRGSPKRLDGIDLFYEFEWYDLFPDWRAQFKNRLSLARLVRADCPDGKTPALLLTAREVEERIIESPTKFVAVINLPRYLSTASPDAAASYYAHHLESGVTGITRLHELAARPEVINAVVDRELELEHIAAWAHGNAERIEQLRGIAGVVDRFPQAIEVRTVVAALQALDALDPEITSAIEGLLKRDIDKDARLRLLRALTEDSTGRHVTTEVLGERIIERLADARNVTQQYSALLRSSDGIRVRNVLGDSRTARRDPAEDARGVPRGSGADVG